MKSLFVKNILFTYWLPLLFSIVFVLLIWLITQIQFKPEVTFPLRDATIYTDSTGLCKDSIPDDLWAEDISETSISKLLSKCVKDLRKMGKNNARKVKIPHEWRKDIKKYPELNSGKVLYHFEIKDFAGISDLWAIALPAVSQNTAVFLNGILLGWGGSFEKPIARNTTRPLIFTIPNGVFSEGINDVDIYVMSQPSKQGFLGDVHLALAEVLKPSLGNYYTFRYTLSWMISIMIGVLSLFMFILWNYRRQDTEYGLFALGGFFWVIHTINQYLVNIPFSGKSWDGIAYSSVGLLAVTGLFFIHRLLDRDYPKYEKILLSITLVLSVLILLLPLSSWLYSVVFYTGSLLAVIIALYVFILAAGYAFSSKKIEWYALALALGIIAEFAIYDLMIVLNFRPLYRGQLLHFGAPFLLLSFAWILLQRFVKTLQVAEKYNHELKQLNLDLEDRVEARGEKIRESYETIRLLGQEQVLLKERSRIMRDMHDGIGVYLTSMLRHLENDTIDKKQLSESAHNALNDLRLMIDSLGSTSTDLPAMLGMFRTRISVALNACNVKLEWHVEELPAISDFGPERALNLLRILQEAFTNALKHSEASRIILSTYSESFNDDRCLINIKITDNGKGFKEDIKNGNGLKNMKYRAKKIKAELTIETTDKGTCITIALPLLASCAHKTVAH